MAKFTRNSSGQKVYSSKKSSTSSSSSKTNSGSSQTTLSNADVKALGALTGKNLSDSSINEARNRANSSGISNANDPIDASKMTNVTAVNPPEMPKVDPANGVVVAGNISVGLNPDGTTKVTEGNTAVANPVQAQLDNYLKAMSETPSAEDIYNSMPEKRAFENAAREEQKYASQINTIVAKSQADQLSTIGQGRGIPEAIIGGQQAQIAREAAIQALPLQALLANAQGNKELAQQQLDTMFKMKMQDAQAQYDYKLKYLGMVYEIADKNEQRRLNEIYRKEDQAFELKKGDIAWERQQLMEQIGFNNSLKLQNNSFANQQALQQSSGNEYGTLTGKPQNASQSSANSYANRLAQANSPLTLLGKNFTGKFAIGASLPNILQSEDRQAFEQAKKNFATAVLRRESGASIAPSEFKTLEEAYFPQPGDGERVLNQKAALRNTVINNFYNEANVARPVMPGDRVESNGVVYQVGADGETLTEI